MDIATTEAPPIENEWADFSIPTTDREIYGLQKFYPKGASQLLIELTAFRMCRKSKRNIEKFGLVNAFHHMLKCVQLLWSDKDVCIQKKYKGGIAKNTYFLDIMHDLCNFRDIGLTGPASCAKTFTVSIFDLVCFYCAPDEFMGLISTTSASASERRVWGDIKSLHRAARFNDNGMTPIGEVIEYMKCLTFNPAKDMGGDMNERDLRNGVLVIPVSNDAKGKQALETIMGSKNKMVSWTVDEGPAMPNDIMAPRIALGYNNYFQFIITGNASERNDPHGRALEPAAGWGSINPDMKRWKANTCDVLFLHGERGPNDIYGDPDAEEQSDLPFPYLSNRFTRDISARVAGNGNIEYGRNTIEYWRFSIGYWIGSDVRQTVLSEAGILSVNANAEPMMWGSGQKRTFAGFDPAFVSGGDSNALMMMTAGYDIAGHFQLLIDNESIEIRPATSNKEEYRDLVAAEVVRRCKERKMDIQDFLIDASSDGGMTAQAVEKAWGLAGVQMLSSLDLSSSIEYRNRVTQYWMSVRKLLETKCMKGFNNNSKYAADLFERRYLNNKSILEIETKKLMKQRIHRSPDHGDAFSYCSYGVWSSGVIPDSVIPNHEEDMAREDKGTIADLLYYRYQKRLEVDQGFEESDREFVLSYED